MNTRDLKKGDLVWYFGKLMYFNYIDKAGNFHFSVPSSNSKTGYSEISLTQSKLALHGDF